MGVEIKAEAQETWERWGGTDALGARLTMLFAASPVAIAVGAGVFLTMPATREAALWTIHAENHPVEILTFLSLLACAPVAALLTKRSYRDGEPWRESEGGSAAERRAKKQAQGRAEKSTNRQNDDTCHRQNGDVSRDKLKPPRHTLKGQERQNLVDFEGSTERLATFPMSGADAAEKYLAEVKDVNVDHVRRAHAWLGEFLEVAG